MNESQMNSGPLLFVSIFNVKSQPNINMENPIQEIINQFVRVGFWFSIMLFFTLCCFLVLALLY